MSFGDSVSYKRFNEIKFDDVVGKLLKKKRFSHKSKYRALVSAWSQVVGPEISEMTRIVGYEHGKLKVGVASSVLLHELKGFMKHTILEELQKTQGAEDVSDIFFLASEN